MPGMTPEELLSIHKQYADQFASIAQSGLAAAFSALSNSGVFNFNPTQIGITFPDFGVPTPVGELPERPEDPELPKLGTLRNFRDIPNDPFAEDSSIGPQAPDGIDNPPTYTAPIKPHPVREFFDTIPEVQDLSGLPTTPPYIPLPNLTLPFTTFNFPVKPTITTPAFEGQRPDAITLPDAEDIVDQYRTEQADHRTQLAAFMTGTADTLIARYCPEYNALRARINNAIHAYTDPTTGGGTGIPTNIENAILARNADRHNLETTRALNEVATTLARKGHVLPGGALQDAVRQAAVGMGDAQARSSTDLAVKNLELEQKHFEFMFKLGEQLEEKMLDIVTNYLKMAIEIDAQAIQSAKELVTAYINAYNLQVAVYRALWEGYRADAEVLRARIEANESQVRLYEAEINAEKAKAEVNNAHVGILRAVADVNLATAQTYKVQLEAALAPLELGRIRLALFEAKARAYQAEVGAYEARWRGYVAEVEGELGAFKAYEAQVSAFTAKITAFKAQVDAYTAQVNAAATTNEAIGKHNESVVRVYSSQADAAIKAYEGQIAGYSAESNIIIKQADIEVEYWRAKANLIFQEFNVAVQQMFEYAREQMNLFRGQMEAAINAANGLAHASQVAGNLAGGAMQGLTSFAGVLESREG